MLRQRGDPGDYAAWARQETSGSTRRGLWRAARKQAVRYHRDGKSIAWVCRAMRVDRQWVHKWWNRWIHGGKTWSALSDRSCRPRRIHTKRHAWRMRILQMRKQHPFGALKLKHVGQIPLSHTTINRILHETSQAEKRPRKQRRFKRFQRPYSNYLWQLDTCQVATRDDGWVYVQTLLDDHSRFILASHALAYPPTQSDSIRLVGRAMRMWGAPLQGLTDNGQEFHSIQRDEPGLFTRFLWRHGVQHIRGRPNHPRTQGKIERWHRSLKHEWLAYRSKPVDRDELQRLLFGWLEFYNTRRPHSALALRTPVEVHLESLILTGRLDPAVNEVC